MIKVFFVHIRKGHNEIHLKLWEKEGWGIRKSNSGGEYNKRTLYVCMEISQWNHSHATKIL
jgi:hypothetical protein